MSKKVIIFDFDGTIADSWKRTIKIAKRLSNETIHRELKEEEIQRMRGKEILEILKGTCLKNSW